MYPYHVPSISQLYISYIFKKKDTCYPHDIPMIHDILDLLQEKINTSHRFPPMLDFPFPKSWLQEAAPKRDVVMFVGLHTNLTSLLYSP